jgi:glycosyltransferase involved in cell wall biosynthesis
MSSDTPPFISFVIPYYNAERGVMDICKSISDNISALDYKHEIVIVDDCSDRIPDREEQQQMRLKENLIYYRMERNRGQSYVTGYGVTKSRGNLVITLDDDLIYDPQFINLITRFFERNKPDVLYCLRKHNAQHSFVRRSLVSLMKWLIYISSRKRVSSIRVLNEKVRKQITDCIELPSFSIDKVIYKNANAIRYISVDVNSIGETRYNFIKLVSVLLQYIGFKV